MISVKRENAIQNFERDFPFEAACSRRFALYKKAMPGIHNSSFSLTALSKEKVPIRHEYPSFLVQIVSERTVRHAYGHFIEAENAYAYVDRNAKMFIPPGDTDFTADIHPQRFELDLLDR